MGARSKCFSEAMIAVFTFQLIFAVFSPTYLLPEAIKQYFYIYYLLINGAVFIILPRC